MFKAFKSFTVDLFIKQAVYKRVNSVVLSNFKVESSCDSYNSLKCIVYERYSVCILLRNLQISAYTQTGLIFNKKSVNIKFVLKNL
jgi:hypothetical protein